MIIGFMDESSPQTTANTQRLWSFGKPTIYKNTNKIKANAFGCYMLNGTSVIDFKEHSTKEDVGEFLKTIREKNPLSKIAILCDNFTSYPSSGITNRVWLFYQYLAHPANRSAFGSNKLCGQLFFRR